MSFAFLFTFFQQVFICEPPFSGGSFLEIRLLQDTLEREMHSPGREAAFFYMLDESLFYLLFRKRSSAFQYICR